MSFTLFAMFALAAPFLFGLFGARAWDFASDARAPLFVRIGGALTYLLAGGFFGGFCMLGALHFVRLAFPNPT
jgi:hypothetical protein